MTDTALWVLICLQITLGGADTLFHHEGTERLAWRPSQKTELRLHGVRNLFYALIFLVLGFTQPTGTFAIVLLFVLFAELFITLWDFVEEDRSRRLPATERVMHTLLALNYGAILTLLVPVLIAWAVLPTALSFLTYGVWSFVCVFASVATAVFGARDLAAIVRLTAIRATPAKELACGLPAGQRILITGATGFVGRRLTAALVEAGHNVAVLTRNPKRAFDHLPAPIRIISNLNQIQNDECLHAIIHLAGEPVSNGLWTAAKKKNIIESRTEITRAITQLIARLDAKPECLIAGSAIGWYGVRENELLTESDWPEACFSHESCALVEAAAREVEILGVRVVRLRTGLVLGTEGGLLARLLLPFEFGLGGRLGDGKQVMSWIALDDVVRLVVYILRNKSFDGAVNGTAPHPVTNAEFTNKLAIALRRPAICHVPAAPLRIALGEFADELLLGGQNVIPEKAQANGFEFSYPMLAGALNAMLGAGETHNTARRVGLTQLTTKALRKSLQGTPQV